MAEQYALPKRTPLSAGKPAVSPSAAVAHQLLDTPVSELVQKFAPQYANRIPPEKASQTFRQVLKTADFMTKGFVMSVVGQHLPKGVTAEDITKAVNEPSPAAAPAEAPAAPAAAPAAAAPAEAPAAGSAAAVPAFAPPRTPAAAGGKDHYRKMREPFAAELKDPATRRLLQGIISAENAGAGSAVAESLMNRTAMVNEARAAKGQPPLTLKAMIQGDPSIGGGKSFYGPVRTGAVNEHMARVDADKGYAAKLDSYISSALGGADTIGGHTDQGSKGDPNYDTGGVGVNINGERFNDWGYGGSRAWREKNQALAGGATSVAEYPDPTPDVGAGQSYYDEKSRYEAENPAAVASTTTSSPGTDTPTEVAQDLGKGIGGGISDAFGSLAKVFAGGGARALPSTPANATAPQAPTSPGIQPIVDPRQAEMQRQQLAMAMQRLNSGKLV